ncbi:MAG: acetyl-coenzyme A synthetase N-terminal domain-containing protein, partial [Dehalococcoidia bacterium]
MVSESQQIESVLQESRVFPPPPTFSATAEIGSMAAYEDLAREAEADPEGFWAKRAEDLHWFKRWERVLDWQPPFAKWFVGGTLNAAYNCLDRHLDGPRRNKAAIIWEGEPGDERILTYQTLHREVSKFANVLKGLGVKRGDRVGIYLPLVPEAVIAMLACARIGAVHSVVFGGFSAEALR